MFTFFKKKKIVTHIKLSGVIGNVGKFKQGIDFSGHHITRASPVDDIHAEVSQDSFLHNPGAAPRHTRALCT